MPDELRRRRPPRPLPQLTPAWENTPEATLPYRTPQQALNDPRTVPYQRQPLQQERDMNRELAQLTDRQSIGGPSGHADGREAREFGSQVMEATGAPSWARGINHLRNNQPGEAIPEFLMGALNTGTLATLHYGAGPARPPMRLPNAPIEAAPRLPNAPPRLPGRATDGSVLPIRPPQPIRQSLVGGSDDLMEAARIGPDAGPVRAGRRAYEDQLRADGFDVETPLYHGTNKPIEGGELRPSESSGGIFLTPHRDLASNYATRGFFGYGQADTGGQVLPVYARLRNPLTLNIRGNAAIRDVPVHISDPLTRARLKTAGDLSYHGAPGWLVDLVNGREPTWAQMIQRARSRGHDGIIFRGVIDNGGRQDQFLVFDATNVRSQFGQGPSRNAPNAGPPRTPPRPRPPPRRPTQ